MAEEIYNASKPTRGRADKLFHEAMASVPIPLDAVDGWWPGAGQRLKPGSAGNGLLGFGVVLPVDADI